MLRRNDDRLHSLGNSRWEVCEDLELFSMEGSTQEGAGCFSADGVGRSLAYLGTSLSHRPVGTGWVVCF